MFEPKWPGLCNVLYHCVYTNDNGGPNDTNVCVANKLKWKKNANSVIGGVFGMFWHFLQAFTSAGLASWAPDVSCEYWWGLWCVSWVMTRLLHDLCECRLGGVPLVVLLSSQVPWKAPELFGLPMQVQCPVSCSLYVVSKVLGNFDYVC
jgi:hypothetical protein